MAEYSKGRTTYDEKKKALLFKHTRVDFIPNQVYTICEDLERRKGYEIHAVIFLNDKSRAYRKEELKKKYDWSELDQEDKYRKES